MTLASTDTDELRAWLASRGAPLVADPTVEVTDGSFEDRFAQALRLARRDSSVARALPVALWRSRRDFDAEKLLRAARRAGQLRTLAFYLDLTGKLGGSPKLGRLAREHVGPAVRTTEFFKLTTKGEKALAARRTPDVARRWGFSMNMPLDSFETLFRKSVRQVAP